ncbi:4-hydroxybenzoate octaprenyltransferase [Sulfuriflexus mobilis]|uniref:4-hydroxybenzoate octaprenyltransferase n=1 Tax=Sulfuriflexus mobilis TaxID=1811807 RepID=UPI0018D57F7F|nr:4-hydroxybenzoate octaprenyltransferase [Sulfuriflexus mobilis]
MRHRLRQYALLMRLDKPIGILLLLWPTLWALWIAAEGEPSIDVFIVFSLGVLLMRSAGCVINDYADRKIDPHVVRTQGRPMATGDVSPREARWLFVGLCLSAFALVLFMNALTIQLSIIGALLAFIYPYTKRYTYLPQVFLGLAFGWAVPMVFAAQTGGVPQLAWLLLTGTVLWATAYDTMYAMVDRDDDIRIGVKSSAILFGEADRLIIGLIQALLILVLLLVGRQAEMGGYYYLGVLVALGLSAYQQVLIHDRQPKACFRAFLNNNWLGMAVFAGILLDYWLR